jgi:hypothetical protein
MSSDHYIKVNDSYLTSGRWAVIGGSAPPPPKKPLVVDCLGKRRYVVAGMGKLGVSTTYRSSRSASRALARWNRRKKADAEARETHEALGRRITEKPQPPVEGPQIRHYTSDFEPFKVECYGHRRYGFPAMVVSRRSAKSAERALARWNRGQAKRDRKAERDAEAIRAHEAGA